MTKFPSWCCQKCGAEIGWLGRAFQWMGMSRQFMLHPNCDKPPVIPFKPFMIALLMFAVLLPLLVR